MYCNKCNTKNIYGVNFCYNCGNKFSENKINKPLMNNNIYVQKSFSLKSFTYNNIILSKNKYRNIFILLSVIVLCSALLVPLCKGLLESFNLAMILVNTNVEPFARLTLKNQTELFFRDVFVRIILILVFGGLVIFNILILMYTYIGQKQQIKKYKK